MSMQNAHKPCAPVFKTSSMSVHPSHHFVINYVQIAGFFSSLLYCSTEICMVNTISTYSVPV